MYWNSLSDVLDVVNSAINRNMRCIEILQSSLRLLSFYRLIETWDVLKCREHVANDDFKTINRNMRCIEISQHLHPSKSLQRLIKTWDVLKSLTDSVFGSGNPD